MRVSDNASKPGEDRSGADARGIDAKDVDAERMATMKKRALLIEEDFSS
jgi:hypothetical protein